MAGVGKTTLARLVFNDDSIEHFDLKAWVSVSDDFDVSRITKAILESITSHPCNLKELNDVQVKLAYELEGKKFLFVLDDLWNEDYGLWEALQPPFRAGALGSKIIVTTRNTNVGKMMGAAESHNLEFISEEDCWEIFKQHALMNGSSDTSADLGIIRQKIVERCSGLPLTARTLGAIYERCFAYCSVFPKDYEFEEKQLVLLWMAEGLIHQGERSNDGRFGAEYFSDLCQGHFSWNQAVINHDS
ncbi:putative disease resistance RPP13-like protein 1 [Morella rubra]|uniref:Putative disease resistance RPP13-like protein 1 n=1 Tax=Morella rubra TaxID=262757 RepID=A0A6A1VIE5_9ROSI|nr:putative disease resistance RPP13-like protein 1 [Morella rubra]